MWVFIYKYINIYIYIYLYYICGYNSVWVCIYTHKYDRTNKITVKSVESNGDSQVYHLQKKTIRKERFGENLN